MSTSPEQPTVDWKLIPIVNERHILPGECQLGNHVELVLSQNASALGSIISAELQAEHEVSASLSCDDAISYQFSIKVEFGSMPEWPSVSDSPGSYGLNGQSGGFVAVASDYAGLVHAWQTLKQILRLFVPAIPCFTILDAPDLLWRIYHIDCKGTRQTLQNLHDILPRLAEFKINALLVEYEDYLVLDRHPDLAVANAISKADWCTWIEAAGNYGMHVIPLVQTLGHWQYVLNKPAYAHLAENPDVPGEGCTSLPGTWELARDLLDEMIAMHPNAPFIHVGLDETADIGTCPRCRKRLGERSRYDAFLEWANRVAEYVSARGKRVLMWADMVVAKLNADQVARLNRNIIWVEWSYSETGLTQPFIKFKNTYISKAWLKRPNGDVQSLQNTNFRPGVKLLESMEAVDRERLNPYLVNPDYPKQLRHDFGTAILHDSGFTTMGASAVRASYHGSIMPKFITGQLNTIAFTNVVRRNNGLGVIASSWARGHSLTPQNSHPDLDWYGIATAGEAGWREFPLDHLRDFDARFAFQFYGQADGTIGDLFYLCERSSDHVDHVMQDYTEYVEAECAALLQKTTRNRPSLELFSQMVSLTRLRYRGEFTLLEIEYFYAVWEQAPEAMRRRIFDDVDCIVHDMDAMQHVLVALYERTLIPEDSAALAKTQLAFLRDSILAMSPKRGVV